MRTLVVAHVYYPQLWAELADCIRNIDGERDLIVTYVDEASVAEARRDFPTARFFKSENRGFDIWPFLQAVRETDLSAYDLVVKLHTKRDFEIGREHRYNWCRYDGARWRNFLLSFCRTPGSWRRTLGRFRDPSVGMVADRHVIVRRNDLPWRVPRECFDAAIEEMSSISGVGLSAATCQYVSGTMFAVRPVALLPLLRRRFSSEDFAASGHADDFRLQYAHTVEHLLGFSVTAAGLRIDSSDGLLAARRIYAPLRELLFCVKVTDREKKYKVLGLTVWRRIHASAPRRIMRACGDAGWPGVVLTAVTLTWMCTAVCFVSRKKVSRQENRRLAELPELSRALEPGYDYGERFERWLGDHFPQRKGMVRASALLRLRGNGLVRQGTDGWLYATVLGSPDVYSHANRFDAGQIERVRRQTVAFGAAAKASGIKKVYFTFSNDKESIYPEFYPAGYAKEHPESRLDQVWKALQGVTPDVATVRFTDRLLALKGERVVFCKSGTHMTDLASYRVYGWLADRIREDFPLFVKVDDGQCVFGRDDRHTDDDLVKLGALPFYPRSLLVNDFVELRDPQAKVTVAEERCDGFRRVVRRMRNDAAGNGLKMFLLTDSFGLRWIPYLAEGVSEMQSVFIGSNDPFDLGDRERSELLAMKPDILIVNFTERFLQRLLTLEFPKGGR